MSVVHVEVPYELSRVRAKAFAATLRALVRAGLASIRLQLQRWFGSKVSHIHRHTHTHTPHTQASQSPAVHTQLACCQCSTDSDIFVVLLAPDTPFAMSSAIHPSHAQQPPRPSVHHVPHGIASMHQPAAPAGTFAPGTKVQVGASRVVIERWLSEGGFAHVYLVRLPQPIGDTDRAVLKRVAVPDKEALANMRTEVETMKKLKGHRQIVTYFDSHASQLGGGGYEVFLLMEFCSGGGLIDFMNTRLQNRLTEPEILKIFSDTAQGVACMHYLKPPLLHRDLKVENILINDNGPTKQFKLCDFGSAAVPRPAATSAAEGRLIEEDVQKHTTMQYRSPEMIDVYRKQPIDEKSDIWALGVLLYKLCYYTTPFEEQGQMAILNASFKYPGHPRFSDRIKKLIGMYYSAIYGPRAD
jgi:AP2-associated kinase